MIKILKKPLFRIPLFHFLLLFSFVIFSLLSVTFYPPCSFIVILGVSLVFLAVLIVVKHYQTLKIKNELWRSTLQEKINKASVDLNSKSEIALSLKEELGRLELLESLANNFSQVNEPLAAYELITHTLAQAFSRCDIIMIYLANPEDTSLNLVYSLNKIPFVKLTDKKGDSLDRAALRAAKGIIIEDTTNPLSTYHESITNAQARGMSSLIVLPLVIRNKDVGVLRLESRMRGYFSIKDLRFVSVVSDLAAVAIDKARLYRRVEELAIKDSLTGLYLRGYFFERLKEEMQKAFIAQKSVGVLMLDIDFFKKINDRYGHVVGDLVLKRLAGIIKKSLGPAGNIACRFGGEEFLVLFPFHSPQEMLTVAEAIRKKVENSSIDFRRNKIKFTVSIGVATFPQDAKMLDDLIMEADNALYRAKKEGRNRVCSTAS
ncbi:MAG: sensor domain-containing diguanylate cyclase [Candidatus Omnitrophica bacterium]|nr:sensor domain-containing diguanylate cyclase [Candidatus Omnitrophota bacterium]